MAVRDDSDRAFLQALMGRGSITADEGRQILAGIATAQTGRDVKPGAITDNDLDLYLDKASTAVFPYDYEVRSAVHQRTRERTWALINTTSDASTQLATTFAPDELSFVKRVLNAIFETYNTPRMEKMCLTTQEAINLSRPAQRRQSLAANEDGAATAASTDKGLRHSDVNRVMDELVSGGWLEKSREGFYSPAPRALVELRTWLVDTYNEADPAPDSWQPIKACDACREIITYGQRCADIDCLARLHDICEEAFFRARRSRTCPRCEKEWSGNKFVGERAVTSTKAYAQAKGKGRKSNTLASDIFHDAQEEDLPEEEPEE